MVNQKLKRPKLIKRTHSILEIQDQALVDLVEIKGESKDFHVRQALQKYIDDNLGYDYPENRKLLLKSKGKLRKEADK